MSKRTSAYWKERFEAIEDASNKYGQKTFRQIEPAFDKAQQQIQAQIESWYGRYAKNNNVTMAEARRQLSTTELKEFRWDVKEYIKYGRENDLNQAWMKELENASARVHISRLEALKVRTQQAAEVAFGNELDCLDDMARKVFTEDYYHSIYEVQKGFGIGWEIGQIDERKLETLVTKPWAADGKNFSDRIWQQRSQLVNELHSQLTRSCVLGKAPDDAIKAISKKFGVTKNQAGRLVMTEQAYFHSVAQKEAFSDLDVEEFEVVATLDSHTSEICQEMDGQHFPMKDYEPGVTAPPFHVWCRSVTVPWFEDNYTGERAARDADGNTYYVPDNMTYKDWKKSMVDGDTDGLKKIKLDDAINLKKSETNDNMEAKESVVKKQRGQLPRIEEDELYSFVANELEISEDKAIQLTDATMAFTDTYFTDVRRYQQGLPISNVDVTDVQVISDSVEEYIELAPTWNGGETFRGLSVSDAELASYQVGKVMDGVKDIGGTASWSNSETTSRFYATSKLTYERPNSVIYHSPTQSKGTGIRHISVYEHENEVLCSKDSVYKIVKIETDAENITHVYLEEVK